MLPCKPGSWVFHMGVAGAYMYENKVDRVYFPYDTFKVSGTHVAKPPQALTFILYALNWKRSIYRL